MKVRIDTLEPRLRPDGCTEVWGTLDGSEAYCWVATFATRTLAWQFINALTLTSSMHVEIEPISEPVPLRKVPVKLTYDQVVSLYHPNEFVGIAEFYRAEDYQAILSQLAQANTKITRILPIDAAPTLLSS